VILVPLLSPLVEALVAAIVTFVLLLGRSVVDGSPAITTGDVLTALAAGAAVWATLTVIALIAVRRWKPEGVGWEGEPPGIGRARPIVRPSGGRVARESETGERFDRFTDRARTVLTLAQDEAQRFDHNYLGTEHLLLGLLREGDGTAAEVLARLGVELPKARMAVEFIVGRGDRPVVGEVGLTPRAKRVIELTIDEARTLGHSSIGTEHLLLGLIREGEGIAAGVLDSLDVRLDRARAEVIRVLDEHGSLG
jgi:hypothetical protein